MWQMLTYANPIILVVDTRAIQVLNKRYLNPTWIVLLFLIIWYVIIYWNILDKRLSFTVFSYYILRLYADIFKKLDIYT